jgi:CheY-like chemotaxis protein
MFDPKPRLLLIDDDAHVRRAYVRVLRHDFEIDPQDGAAGALIGLATGPAVDVILCDRDLGAGMSGQGFFESIPLELQERTVMCSGTEPDEDDAFANGLGDRYFLKPGHVATLIATLLRLAGGVHTKGRSLARDGETVRV